MGPTQVGRAGVVVVVGWVKPTGIKQSRVGLTRASALTITTKRSEFGSTLEKRGSFTPNGIHPVSLMTK